jgi:hypothetical protein
MQEREFWVSWIDGRGKPSPLNQDYDLSTLETDLLLNKVVRLIGCQDKKKRLKATGLGFLIKMCCISPRV